MNNFYMFTSIFQFISIAEGSKSFSCTGCSMTSNHLYDHNIISVGFFESLQLLRLFVCSTLQPEANKLLPSPLNQYNSIHVSCDVMTGYVTT